MPDEPALSAEDTFIESLMDTDLYSMGAYFSDRTPDLVDEVMERSIAIEERGLRMGRDISVIIHDDDLSYMKNGEDVPIFTATRSSVREAGRIAAEMLLGLIAQPGSEPPQRLLEADLIIGQSTGPALKD